MATAGSKMKSFDRKMLLVQLGKEGSQQSRRASIDRKRAQDSVAARTILIIDDEQSALELASHILVSDGFRVRVATTVKEGKDLLQSDSEISLVITDLRMPDEDGFSVLEFLRENLRFSHIPAIVSSCCSHQDKVSRAIELGAADYLTKPFNAESLLSRVHRVFERTKGMILVVSEDDLQRSILIRILSAAGFEIVAADTGAQALNVLAGKSVRLVISELVLEDMTGLDLMMEAQGIASAMPFLFLDDPVARLTDDDIRSAGGFGLIDRPLSNVDILHKVKVICGRRS
jgi:DNA-binding response OmpR family regulator